MIKTQQRNLSLDSLRGIMLIIITINHTSGPFHNFTFQPFGYVSAAEGFTFLSAILVGLINGKRLLRCDVEVVKNALFQRSRIIYLYHLLTIFIITAPWMLSSFIRNHYSIFQLDSFFHQPLESFTYYALLLNQPALLDILPMYVLFIFTGYFILLGFHYNKKNLVLLSSFALWLLSQFNWLELFDLNLNLSPLIHLGYFNPCAWQFLFTIGCYLGYCSATGKNILPSTPKLTQLALFVSLIFFFARHNFDNKWFICELIRNNADRANLELLRLINFAATAYLIRLIIESVPNFRSVWLETLGQHSLQTFTFHIIMVYYLSPFKETLSTLGPHYELLAQFISVAALIIPALLHKYLQKTFPTIKLTGL
jgi:hypothetical protein